MKLIDKSALVAEIKRLDEYYHLSKDAGGQAFIEGLLSFLDTLEAKEVDLEKEKVENIKKQCPFREVVCSMYQNHPLKCSGACAFVSDRITLEKKHLNNAMARNPIVESP